MERRPLRALISERSFDRWHAYARHHGVTATGLADAIGETLDPDVVQLDLEAAVARARELDRARRQRQ